MPQVKDEQWVIPKLHALTPEKLAEAEAQQAELRQKYAGFNHAQLGPRDRARKQAATRIPTLVSQLAQTPENSLVHRNLKQQLYEAYALTGQFAMAATSAVTETQLERMTELSAALDRDDDDLCKCPPECQHISLYVFARNQDMPVIKCAGCEMMNIRPLLPHLAKMQAARRESERLTAGMHPKDAVNVLRNAGLTTERVLADATA